LSGEAELVGFNPGLLLRGGEVRRGEERREENERIWEGSLREWR